MDEVQATTQREAANVENLHELAARLPQPERGEIQGLTLAYLRAMVEEEWPSLLRP